MKFLAVPTLASLALGACALVGASWSSDVCGCAPAWTNLAVDLGLSNVDDADDLTLSTVQGAAGTYIGKQLSLADLPDTGSGDSCVPGPGGARCNWKLWYCPPQYKGYVADFSVDPAGRITSVSVSEHVWVIDGGT
jgi:hypothetical protein